MNLSDRQFCIQFTRNDSLGFAMDASNVPGLVNHAPSEAYILVNFATLWAYQLVRTRSWATRSVTINVARCHSVQITIR